MPDNQSSGQRHTYPATAAPHPAIAAQPYYGEPDGIRIACDRNGQFVTRCELSSGSGRDVPIDMLIDTGATDTTLNHAAARALGVPLSRLTYNQPVSTASGHESIRVIPVRQLSEDAYSICRLAAPGVGVVQARNGIPIRLRLDQGV